MPLTRRCLQNVAAYLPLRQSGNRAFPSTRPRSDQGVRLLPSPQQSHGCDVGLESDFRSNRELRVDRSRRLARSSDHRDRETVSPLRRIAVQFPLGRAGVRQDVVSSNRSSQAKSQMSPPRLAIGPLCRGPRRATEKTSGSSPVLRCYPQNRNGNCLSHRS